MPRLQKTAQLSNSIDVVGKLFRAAAGSTKELPYYIKNTYELQKAVRIQVERDLRSYSLFTLCLLKACECIIHIVNLIRFSIIPLISGTG